MPQIPAIYQHHKMPLQEEEFSFFTRKASRSFAAIESVMDTDRRVFLLLDKDPNPPEEKWDTADNSFLPLVIS